MTQKGVLYLIPVPLCDDAAAASFALHTQGIINNLQHFLVENEKTARKFLKQAGLSTPQNDLILFDYGKHQRQQSSYEDFFKILLSGKDAGLMSEAGCPGIADPGAEIVAQAHQKGIKIVPLVGPSSILLALMASGFNGQRFTFQGYLPIDKAQRTHKIKELEKIIEQQSETQIFIETPFRNHNLMEELLKTCKPNLKLCVACDLTAKEELIITKSIAEWKNIKYDYHKKPCIFLLYH